MAAGDLLIAEGWESGTDSWNPITGFTTNSSYSRVASSGLGVRTGTDSGYAWRNFGYNVKEIIFGFSINFEGLVKQDSNDAAETLWLISWYDGTNGQCGIHISTAGYLSFGTRSGWDRVTDFATGSSQLSINRWYWMEGKLGIDPTNGYFQLYVNGNLEFDLSGINTARTGNDYADRMVLSYSDAVWTTPESYMKYDDLYMLDNDGDTLSYWGDIRILDLAPTSDGYYNQFSPSTPGDNFPMVDERTANDSDYVTASSTGSLQTFYYEDLPVNAALVRAVIHGVRLAKTDAGPRFVRSIQRQDGTDYERVDTDTSVPLTPETFLFYEPTNPATGNDWTVADVNSNAEFGIKLQS